MLRIFANWPKPCGCIVYNIITTKVELKLQKYLFLTPGKGTFLYSLPGGLEKLFEVSRKVMEYHSKREQGDLFKILNNIKVYI